ncbi:MAG: hypothetical protein MUF62_01185 [Chitinophagaceae bacterium]|jgi:hypothetical protein|nr:hypothetical protein [Chitinophagaceae bacterium]
MQQKTKIACWLAVLMAGSSMAAQAQGYKDGRLWLNSDGTQYLKMTATVQVWARHTWLNPGSAINGFHKAQYSDIGIRRLRMQLYGQVARRIFFYTQFGQNNFNFLADRKQGFFVHDALGEYELLPGHMSIGMGLTGWSGLSRFASPAIGSLAGLDAPLFEQTTNDVTDQFLRKLSVYSKGKWGRLDYRLVLSQPLAVQKSAGYIAQPGSHASFAAQPPHPLTQAYCMWQLLDKEADVLPYTTGTYLGSKRVFNIGAGFQYQPRAMWLRKGNDTSYTAMANWAVDVYYDAPLAGKNGSAISAYASFTRLQFGQGYLRNSAPMNMANGGSTGYLNGPGNGYPAYGSGQVWYAQLAWLLPINTVAHGQLMPYASCQHAQYDALDKEMNYYDAGINWLLSGHQGKFTLAYQDRPIYKTTTEGNGQRQTRHGALVLQYQVFLN